MVLALLLADDSEPLAGCQTGAPTSGPAGSTNERASLGLAALVGWPLVRASSWSESEFLEARRIKSKLVSCLAASILREKTLETLANELERSFGQWRPARRLR